MKNFYKVLIGLLFFIAASFSALAQGPLHYWNFDQCSGSNVYDQADGLNGTVMGATWTAGYMNQGLSYDGDDYVTFGNAQSVNFEHSDPFSVSAWVRRSNEGTEVVISKMIYQGTYRGWMLWFYSGAHGTNRI